MNRNETWAQGSQPGDAPIDTQIVPITPEELALQAAQQRLATAGPGPWNPGEIQQMLRDLLTIHNL